jgi:hypothetical protein
MAGHNTAAGGQGMLAARKYTLVTNVTNDSVPPSPLRAAPGVLLMLWPIVFDLVHSMADLCAEKD